MKKIIFSISILLCLSCLVDVNASDCSPNKVLEYQQKLSNFDYKFEYIPGFTDENANEAEGYFLLTYNNLPENFEFAIKTTNGVYSSKTSSSFPLNGGIYTFLFYHDECDQIIKSYDIKVPYYKQYCELEGKCSDKYIWFDGTYENKIENQNNQNKTKVSIKLIVVLVSLIVIILVFTGIIFVKRRQTL